MSDKPKETWEHELVNGTHPTHKTRYSDSSGYDEKCDKCGGTDSMGEDTLRKPCKETY